MNAYPGMTCLSPADARNAYYVYRRSRYTRAPLRPAVWRNPRGYTFSISAQAFEVHRRADWILIEEIPVDQQ